MKEKSPDDDLSITLVAYMLKRRYAKTRDMMLTGKLGEPKYTGRTLTVKRAAVEAFLRKEKSR